MKHQQKPIVIVKKRKHSGHGGGHGSWKIAYADFMTAMMAFFLVMWLISIASPAQLAQIADYFRTPLAAAISGGPNLTENSSPVPNNGEGIMHQGDVKQNQAQPNDLDKLQKEMDKLSDMKRLKKLHGDLDQLIETNPDLRALRPHLRIDMVKEGLRIQIIDSKNRPMFRLGSTDVEPYMREILRAIAPVLNTIPNKITISGHTDDLPYASGERSYSNWELSADRANASRRELVGGGLDDGKVLRVIGMSSTMNIAHQADDPLNRRISLVVLNKEAEQEILQNNTESKNTPLKELKNNNTSNKSNKIVTEQTATEPVTTEPVTTEPATTEPATTEPVTTEPATTEPATTEPATTEPVTTEPVTTEPATTEPATTEPATTEPVTTESVTTAPSVSPTPLAPVQQDADAPATDSNVTVPIGSSQSVVPPVTDSAAATLAAPAAQPATR